MWKCRNLERHQSTCSLSRRVGCLPWLFFQYLLPALQLNPIGDVPELDSVPPIPLLSSVFSQSSPLVSLAWPEICEYVCFSHRRFLTPKYSADSSEEEERLASSSRATTSGRHQTAPLNSRPLPQALRRNPVPSAATPDASPQPPGRTDGRLSPTVPHFTAHMNGGMPTAD